MSVLKLVREVYSKDRTIGRLFIDDIWFCFTLEDTCRCYGVKVGGETAIPAAANTYKVKLNYSNKFKRELPIIYTESNGYEIKHAGIRFKGVRFHGGNDPEDTWGCPLVAFQTDNHKIWETAERALVERLKAYDDITLTIQNLRYDG